MDSEMQEYAQELFGKYEEILAEFLEVPVGELEAETARLCEADFDTLANAQNYAGELAWSAFQAQYQLANKEQEIVWNLFQAKREAVGY